jgi:hypothetical protein
MKPRLIEGIACRANRRGRVLGRSRPGRRLGGRAGVHRPGGWQVRLGGAAPLTARRIAGAPDDGQCEAR